MGQSSARPRSSAVGVDEVDPLEATSVAEFAECLRAVRRSAGNPSYRALERWGEQNRLSLPRSTVQDALAGRRLPRKALVHAFLRACGVPANDRRWEEAWSQLVKGTDRKTKPASGILRRLTRSLDHAGLLQIGSTYLGEMQWKELFSQVVELDIVVAYGQTWRNVHARELALVAARPECRVSVFLPDPEDQLTIDVLAQRFDLPSQELRDRIGSCSADFRRLRRPGGAQIEVLYRPGDRVLSIYRFDTIAVVGLYSHSKTRAAAVPVFVCSAPGELFEFVLEELTAIRNQSELYDPE